MLRTQKHHSAFQRFGTPVAAVIGEASEEDERGEEEQLRVGERKFSLPLRETTNTTTSTTHFDRSTNGQNSQQQRQPKQTKKLNKQQLASVTSCNKSPSVPLGPRSPGDLSTNKGGSGTRASGSGQTSEGSSDFGGDRAEGGSLGGQGGASGAGGAEQNNGDNHKKPTTEDGSESDGKLGALDSDNYSAPLVWRNIFLFVILHSSLPIGLWLLYQGRVRYMTLLWSLAGVYLSGLGVTGGAHRLWSHKAYKARWPVQVLLMCLQTMAGQNSIYTWCRDHRVHHKFSETHADPHNIKRGFFFAHMGWLCCRKHPEVREKGALIDMSDLEANPIVMFQHKHFWWMATLWTVLIPSYLPVLLWGERFWSGFTFAFMIRYMVTLHGTWLVNSAAHYFGSRPYDERIEARESPFVIATGLGEGFHNYHHTFPYDYSTSEFGKFFNITTAFIDLCASLGLVYDRRSMSRATIESRRQRTGDRSRY